MFKEKRFRMFLLFGLKRSQSVWINLVARCFQVLRSEQDRLSDTVTVTGCPSHCENSAALLRPVSPQQRLQMSPSVLTFNFTPAFCSEGKRKTRCFTASRETNKQACVAFGKQRRFSVIGDAAGTRLWASLSLCITTLYNRSCQDRFRGDRSLLRLSFVC